MVIIYPRYNIKSIIISSAEYFAEDSMWRGMSTMTIATYPSHMILRFDAPFATIGKSYLCRFYGHIKV